MNNALFPLTPWHALFPQTAQRLLGNGNDDWFTPAIDIAETPEQYELKLDLPGLTQENFSVEMKDGQLWITGKREQTERTEGTTWHRVERRYGQFRRVIGLPENVDAGQVSAEYTDGVLHVVLPKVAERQPRKISVNVRQA